MPRARGLRYRAREVDIAVALVVLVLPVVFAAVLVRDVRRAWRSIRFMQKGRYREARGAHELLGRSWMGLLPGVRSASRYSVALTLHMEGDFEGSLAELATLDRRSLDRHLTYAVSSLEATNLVLVGRDPARAVKLLEDVASIHQPPEDLLFLAHARHALGEVQAAEELLARAGKTREGGGVRVGRTVLIEDRAHHDAIFHTMRGLLLIKLGRNDEAMHDFRRAGESPLSNCYTERARALLPPRDGETDPRSSLAPQVLEDRQRG